MLLPMLGANLGPFRCFEIVQGFSMMAAHNSSATSPPDAVKKLFVRVAENARTSGVFASVAVDTSIECAALESAAPATYSVEFDHAKAAVYVGLTMADRWLSESIESQLVEHGDKMEELLEDELVELDYFVAGGTPITKIEHFRSDAKLFTFRAIVGLEAGDMDKNTVVLTRALLAFEACFRQLGDMQGGE